ncbi:hypothetical protein LCGC14_0442740 [marine sediment metagenome]|uniref:Uncharacterized protein n=1 Tax=marine sediment metagenome TaxID=412755 RepID=A0A0F9SQZ4_9ZZZZ
MRKIEIKTCPVLKPVWNVGDRVQRRLDAYDDSSAVRRGRVALRYSIYDNGIGYDTYHGDYPEVYAVQWDGGRLEKGFLAHGLDKEDVTSKRAYAEYVQAKIAGELD